MKERMADAVLVCSEMPRLDLGTACVRQDGEVNIAANTPPPLTQTQLAMCLCTGGLASRLGPCHKAMVIKECEG